MAFGFQIEAQPLPTTPVDNCTEYRVMLPGYCFARSTKLEGGWDDRPHGIKPGRIDPAMDVRKGEYYLFAQPERVSTFRDRPGMTLLLINATDKDIFFGAQDNRLSIVQEALMEDGQWRPIEYLASSWCGNSYHWVALEPGEYWQFAAPRYRGEFRTKLRFRFFDQTRDGSADIVSNEFDGGINLEQLVVKEGHSRTNLMDPISDLESAAPRSFYERVKTEFETAELWKPWSASIPAGDVRLALAPLIVAETPLEAGPFPNEWRVARPIPLTHERGDDNGDRGRIAVKLDTVIIHGHPYPRLTYSWHEERWDQNHNRTLRIITDAADSPLVIEVIPGHGVDLLFVSKSLEAAAREAFGPPLPARQYSVEKSAQVAPQTFVARVLEEGPVPMGPYVYIDKAGRITTLLCRCSPSQVNRFERTGEYEISNSTNAFPSELQREPPNLAWHSWTGVNSYVYRPLEERLRFPPGFGAKPKDTANAVTKPKDDRPAEPVPP